jgi:hypothetical protein
MKAVDQKARREKQARLAWCKQMDLQIAWLVKAGRRMRKSRARSAPEIYLRKVYQVYWQWESFGNAKAWSWRTARVCKARFWPSAHPLKILIDATAGLDDRRVRSRWGRALQFAQYRNTYPDDLRILFREHGGVAGCAQKFTTCRQTAHV